MSVNSVNGSVDPTNSQPNVTPDVNTQNYNQSTQGGSFNQPNNQFNNQPVGQEEKMIAALSYLIFFLPLVTEPRTEFKVFHANQSLILLLFVVIANLISSLLTLVLIGFILFPIVNILAFILFILGIVNAFNGEKKRLPVIGNLDLLKF